MKAWTWKLCICVISYIQLHTVQLSPGYFTLSKKEFLTVTGTISKVKFGHINMSEKMNSYTMNIHSEKLLVLFKFISGLENHLKKVWFEVSQRNKAWRSACAIHCKAVYNGVSQEAISSIFYNKIDSDHKNTVNAYRHKSFLNV